MEWLTVRDGIAEVAGVPKPVMRAFSRRRAEIEAALTEQGTSSARAAEAAALATRQSKDKRTGIEDLAREWRTRADALGFGRPELGRAIGHRQRRRPGEADVERVFDDVASPAGPTRAAATFSRRDVVQALCERLPPSHLVDAASLETLADAFLASARVVPLLATDEARESRGAFRRRDGRLLPVAREEQMYSTPELLALERRLVDTAIASRHIGAGQATENAVKRAVSARATLSGEQQAMVEELCLSGDRVSVVVGKAGTGKTYALGAARDAWQASNRPVLGVAVARRAANQLQADSGIATTSVTALLAGLERDRTELPSGAVLVVDEAAMVATRQLALLLDAVERADGKLVLVGDHGQLPELAAGGVFRALVRRGLAVELTENRRQREAWERKALDQLRDGDPRRAITEYVAHDRIRIADTPAETHERLVSDWHAAGSDDVAVMIAQRRADVADLNHRVRAMLRVSGSLGSTELALPGGGFAVGDLVVVKRNDARLGVTNGERGRVLAVDTAQHQLVVELGGTPVALDRTFLTTPTVHGDPALLHGYAITCHVAQGLTVDRAFVLADNGLTRELAYTAMSRGRIGNNLYLARHPDDPRAEYAPGSPTDREPLERLADALRTSRATVLAIDAGRDEPSQHLAHARQELATLRAQRAGLECRRWRPGRRAELTAARARETAAHARVEQLTLATAEQRHASRPFLENDDISRTAAQMRDRLIERRLDQGRSRGLER